MNSYFKDDHRSVAPFFSQGTGNEYEKFQNYIFKNKITPKNIDSQCENTGNTLLHVLCDKPNPEAERIENLMKES